MTGLNLSPLPGVLGAIDFGAAVLIVFHTLFFLFPILGSDFAYDAFYRVIMLGCGSYCLSLFNTFGRPQFSKDYAMKIARDEGMQQIMAACMFATSRPTFLGIVPIALRTGMMAALYLQEKFPSLASKLQPITSLKGLVAEFIATAEVGTGILLVFNLLTANRNFILLFIYWQYLRMKYIVSSNTQRAFANFGQNIDNFTKHSYCPRFVGTVWAYVQGAMWKSVDPNELQKQADSPSLLNKCSIM